MAVSGFEPLHRVAKWPIFVRWVAKANFDQRLRSCHQNGWTLPFVNPFCHSSYQKNFESALFSLRVRKIPFFKVGQIQLLWFDRIVELSYAFYRSAIKIVSKCTKKVTKLYKNVSKMYQNILKNISKCNKNVSKCSKK